MARPSKNSGSGRSGRGQSGPGSGRASGRGGQTKRHFPRTARLNTLLQEIVAGHLERMDDDRIGMVTVTGVEVDNDLNRAQVFISTFDPVDSAEAEEAYLDALGDYRKAIQSEIGKQARLRKTPEVVFAFDPGVRAGARIEEILATLDPPSTDGPDDMAAEAEETDGPAIP